MTFLRRAEPAPPLYRSHGGRLEASLSRTQDVFILTLMQDSNDLEPVGVQRAVVNRVRELAEDETTIGEVRDGERCWVPLEQVLRPA